MESTELHTPLNAGANQNKQRGISMLDSMLAMVVAAFVLGSAYVVFKKSTNDNRNNGIESAVVALASGIQSKWNGFGSYQGITNAAVYNANLVVKPLTYNTTGTVIGFPDGVNAVTVASASPYNTFTLSFTLPIGGMCTDLMNQLASIMTDATVNSVDVFTAGALDPSKVATNCADSVPVVLTFH